MRKSDINHFFYINTRFNKKNGMHEAKTTVCQGLTICFKLTLNRPFGDRCHLLNKDCLQPLFDNIVLVKTRSL